MSPLDWRGLRALRSQALVYEDAEGVDWRVIHNQLALSALLYVSGILILIVWSCVDKCCAPAQTSRNELMGVSRVLPVNAWQRFKIRWVGDSREKPQYESLERSLRGGQFLCSSIIVVQWIMKTYTMDVEVHTYCIDFTAAIVLILHLIYTLLQHGKARYFHMETVLDFLTLPPLFAQLDMGGGQNPFSSWMTVSYLRAYRILNSMERLGRSQSLEMFISEIHLKIIITLLKFVCLVVSLSGTMYVLEVLGDMEGFTDKYIETEMGEVSFFSMCYFTFITMSTVGYGDYSPRTVLGRLFVFLLITVGVTFFSIVSVEFVELHRLQSSGSGRYHPNPLGCGHVIVTGSGVQCGSSFAIESFVGSLCGKGRPSSALPRVILLARTPISPEVHAMTMCKWAKGHVMYFVGSALSTEDLERVACAEAKMVFVICNINSTNSDEDDEHNILRAASVMRAFPFTPLRLILLRVQKLDLAISLGIPRASCYALNTFKSSLCSTNLHAIGLSSLVLNLGLPSINLPTWMTHLPSRETCVPDWVVEYVNATRFEPHGFLANDLLLKLNFTQASLVAAAHGVILIAAQSAETGRVAINPGACCEIQAHTVLFGLCHDPELVAKLARSHGRCMQWISTLRATRRAAASNTPAEAETDNDPLTQSDSEILAAKKPAVLQRTLSYPRRSMFPGVIAPLMHARAMQKRLDAKSHVAARPAQSAEDQAEAHLHFLRTQQAAAASPDLAASLAAARFLAPPRSADEKEQLRAVCAAGGHVVIALLGEKLWQQLESIVARFRGLRFQTPIVVMIGASHPHPTLFSNNRYSDLYYIQGSAKSVQDLELAGVPLCARFVSIGEICTATEDEFMVDLKNNMIVAVVESQMRRWKRPDLVVLFDYVSSNNLGQLPARSRGACAPPAQSARNVARENPIAEALLASIDRGSNFIIGSEAVKPRCGADLAPLSDGNSDDHVSKRKCSEVFKIDPRLHERFITGEVIPRNEVLGAYGVAFYTPGAIELLEGIVDPVNSGATERFASGGQVLEIPICMINQPYRKIAHFLLGEGAVPIGVLTEGVHPASMTPVSFTMTLSPLSERLVTADDYIVVCCRLNFVHAHQDMWSTQDSLDASVTGEVNNAIRSSDNSAANDGETSAPVLVSFGRNLTPARRPSLELPPRRPGLDESLDDPHRRHSWGGFGPLSEGPGSEHKSQAQ